MSLPKKVYRFKFFCSACRLAHTLTFDSWEAAEAKWLELRDKVQSIQPNIEIHYI